MNYEREDIALYAAVFLCVHSQSSDIQLKSRIER